MLTYLSKCHNYITMAPWNNSTLPGKHTSFFWVALFNKLALFNQKK